MPMKSPPHPGRSIKDACLEPLALNITEGARILGVARHTLSRVIHGCLCQLHLAHFDALIWPTLGVNILLGAGRS